MNMLTYFKLRWLNDREMDVLQTPKHMHTDMVFPFQDALFPVSLLTDIKVFPSSSRSPFLLDIHTAYIYFYLPTTSSVHSTNDTYNDLYTTWTLNHKLKWEWRRTWGRLWDRNSWRKSLFATIMHVTNAIASPLTRYSAV